MTMIEGSMMVMGPKLPKLETYRYTPMDPVSDDSIDSDDEQYNYVIDLDYQEDSNESVEKQPESMGKQPETLEKQPESPKNEVSETLEKDTKTTEMNAKETTFTYTLKEEPILKQIVNDKDPYSEPEVIENITGKDQENYCYTLHGAKSDLIIERHETVMINKNDSTVVNEPKSDNINLNYGAINTNVSTTECNINLSSFGTETTAKPVGASKRKRKLENTITNLIKAKSVCVRETSVQDSSPKRLSNLSRTVDTSSLSSVIPDHSRSSSIQNQHSLDLSQKSQSLAKPGIPLSLSKCYSSVISSFNPSPSSNKSLQDPAIPRTALNTPQHQPTLFKESHIPKSGSLNFTPKSLNNESLNLTQKLYNNGSLNLTQKSSNRRKNSIAYRCDNVEDNNSFNQDVLNLTVKEIKQEPVKQEISNQDMVIDLSKSSKSRDNQQTSNGYEGVMDLSKPSKAIGLAVNTPVVNATVVKDEPVDLSNTSLPSKFTNQEIKEEPQSPNGRSTDQLQVMDIFKDMMTQEKGGSVTMQQFMSWMQKMQPGFMQNLNMMQLNAYYMQFNYWMQAFYNNTLMNGLANQKGIETHLQQQKKNEKQRKGQRRSMPAPLGPNNKLLHNLPDKTIDQHPSRSSDNVTEDVISNLKDYDANRMKDSHIEFPSCPEMNVLKGKYGCYIAERDGKIKFFVKDNEEIKTIVDLVMAVADLKENETQDLERDENGLCARFVCRICEQKFFHSEHLSKHVKTLHVQKRYQCDQCERSFHDAGNYRQHMRVHDASDIPYECPECNRRFRHKCTLKVHLRIHTGEKPFKCDVCQATFKISSGLQTHMRKHTGETPYACEFCSLRFKCQSNLKQHLFQHTQARPFPCDICGKSYSRKSIRDSHMLTHYKDSAESSDLNVTI